MQPPGTSFASFARPGAGGGAGAGSGPESSLTATVYGAIREERYVDAIRLLTAQLQSFPRSRAALSLLGYCYFALSDYRSSAQCYEELVKFYPEVDAYKLYYAQCLAKAGLYPEATRACMRIDSADQLAVRLLQLQAAIKYEGAAPVRARAARSRLRCSTGCCDRDAGCAPCARPAEDDLPAARALLDRCVSDDPDTMINKARGRPGMSDVLQQLRRPAGRGAACA